MNHLVLTFLSTAAALSTTLGATQDTVTGASAGTAPVAVEGYENSSGDSPQPLKGAGALLDTPVRSTQKRMADVYPAAQQRAAVRRMGRAASAPNTGPTEASQPPGRCRVIRYFYGSQGVMYTRVCNP